MGGWYEEEVRRGGGVWCEDVGMVRGGMCREGGFGVCVGVVDVVKGVFGDSKGVRTFGDIGVVVSGGFMIE